MPYWKWKPDNCRLDEVDAAKFCRVMEGRKGILFVGERASNMEGGREGGREGLFYSASSLYRGGLVTRCTPRNHEVSRL